MNRMVIRNVLIEGWKRDRAASAGNNPLETQETRTSSILEYSVKTVRDV